MKRNADSETLQFLQRQEDPLGSVPAESHRPPIEIRDRIRQLVRVPARDLLRNPKNWRGTREPRPMRYLGC
jgi:hypothetical protein